MLYPVKMQCDVCGFNDHTKLILARVDIQEQDVYLDVQCPKCGHTGAISFVSLVHHAMSEHPSEEVDNEANV